LISLPYCAILVLIIAENRSGVLAMTDIASSSIFELTSRRPLLRQRLAEDSHAGEKHQA